VTWSMLFSFRRLGEYEAAIKDYTLAMQLSDDRAPLFNHRCGMGGTSLGNRNCALLTLHKSDQMVFFLKIIIGLHHAERTASPRLVVTQSPSTITTVFSSWIPPIHTPCITGGGGVLEFACLYLLSSSSTIMPRDSSRSFSLERLGLLETETNPLDPRCL